MKEIYTGIISVICTSVIYLLGGIDVALSALLVAILLDYISGLLKAYITKELSSKTGFRGLIKKVAILIVIMLAVLVDRVTGNSGAIRTLVIYYFVANEGLSILENLAKAGVPVPKKLRDALKTLKKDNK